MTIASAGPSRGVRACAAFAVTAAALVTLCPSPAMAGTKASDRALATQLFDDGEKLMTQKHYAAACSKFHESERLDPQLGTLLHLADCYEKAGRFATAWSAFKDGAEIAAKRGDPRESVALRRVAALEKKLPRLTILVKGADTPGLQVQLDGELIGRPAWNEAAPIDPGTHTVVVSATAHAVRTYTVTLVASEKKTLAVGPGAPLATAPAPATAPAAAGVKAKAPPGAASTRQQRPATADRGTGSGSRTLGYVIAGVGVVGVGVGGVTGAMVFGKKSTVNAHCDASKACDAQGMNALSSARTLSTVSTVAFIAGAVGIGAGAYLIFSSRSKSAPTTALSTRMLPGGAALAVTREF